MFQNKTTQNNVSQNLGGNSVNNNGIQGSRVNNTIINNSYGNTKNIPLQNTKLLLNNNGDSMRFLNIKYKIYIFILVLFILFGYQSLIDAYDNYKLSLLNFEQKREYFMKESDKYTTYYKQQAFINKINKNKENIVSCLNLNNGCQQLDEKIKSDLSVVRSYLQLGYLNSKKMDIDEKKILQHLNEFLLVVNPFVAGKKQRNGKFISMNIGDPNFVEGKLWKVPVSMKITFPTKEDVLSFLENLEHRVYWTKLYGFDKTILYKIDELNYDVMNYETMQDVDIKLTAYYIK